MGLYTILHCHDKVGSVGDSILSIKDYIQKVKEMGGCAAAITNHGSLSTMFSFYRECLDKGIKPIIGYEAYEVDDVNICDKDQKRYHLILLAKNNTGMKNLLHMANEAAVHHFYGKPRIDASLMSQYGEGIIAMSACVGGRIPSMILNNESDDAIEMQIALYKTWFDDFYLELQSGSFTEQKKVNKKLVSLSDSTKTELVLTNDVHYLNQEDSIIHDAHIKLNRKQFGNTELIYKDTCYYVMTYDEIAKSVSYLPSKTIEKALRNTNIIGSQCNVTLSMKLRMPCPPQFSDPDMDLARLAYDSLKEKWPHLTDPSVYMSRLDYELKTLSELQFSGYFLVVRDYVLYAKEHNIPIGPGRGSCGGSLAAFLVGITDVDPIKYNLLFERFLSVHRKGSIPDIDIDIAPDDRPKIFKHIVDTYGYDHCALIGTLGMRKMKKSIRDAGRILNIDLNIVDSIAKQVPAKVYTEEGETAEPDFKNVPMESFRRQYPKWYDLSKKLAGYPSYRGIHAAGIIISPDPLTDLIPLTRCKEEYVMATELDKEEVEQAGFVKMDILVLSTLKLIQDIQTIQSVPFSYTDNSVLQDKEVWDSLNSSDTYGIFQLSSHIYSSRMKKLHPRSIQELANILALLRGPSVSTGADTVYMKRLNHEEPVESIHPIYDDATKDTLGVLIYQEQIMQIGVNAGLDMETSFRIMKALSKKKADKVRAFYPVFVHSCIEQGAEQETADYIWSLLINASKYSFNRAHAISYALLSYHTAYLRVHAPEAFYAALLTHESEKGDKNNTGVNKILRILKKKHIRILPININTSEWRYTVWFDTDKKPYIREGFCNIKGVGEKAASEIIRVRKDHPFSSFVDFRTRVERRICNKNVQKALVDTSCFGLIPRTIIES